MRGAEIKIPAKREVKMMGKESGCGMEEGGK